MSGKEGIVETRDMFRIRLSTVCDVVAGGDIIRYKGKAIHGILGSVLGGKKKSLAESGRFALVHSMSNTNLQYSKLSYCTTVTKIL